jgi:hypothetical protein
MDRFVKRLVRGSEKEKRNENEESDNDSRASALASNDTTQSPIAAGNTAVATDEDTAVATDEDTAVATDEDIAVTTDEDTAVAISSSINKQRSTQITVAYKELLSGSDDPANDTSENRLERQSRIERGP